MKVISIGELVIDHVLYLEGSREGYRWSVKNQEILIGGTGANVAVSYRVLGCEVCLATTVSSHYTELYSKLEETGISVRQIAHGELSVNYNLQFLSEPRRIVAVHPGTALSGQLSMPQTVESIQGSWDILHVAPIALHIAREIPRACKAKLKVLSPASEFVSMHPSEFRALISQYDLVSLDLEEACRYTHLMEVSDVLRWFDEIDGLCTVITLADKGAVAQCKGITYHQSGLDITLPVVDTMGCGDMFASAFALSYSETRDIRYSLLRATRCARAKAAIRGMWPAWVDKQEAFQSRFRAASEI